MDELGNLLGASPAMEALRGSIRKLARGASRGSRLPPVLITGETGTGKGLLARLLHQTSSRSSGHFVEINCGAIPESLMESELFGFERGAFTDARRSKPGLFQVAHDGSIFLDEIGLLSPALQAKLLKVLEDGAVRRLGATRNEPCNVRVISATNIDLAAAIREGRFRQDLYHRLAVVSLGLPPLRDRDRDVIILAEHFLARACRDYRLPPRELTPDAQRCLLEYDWPGNVRELANVIERAAVMTESSHLTAGELNLRVVGPAPHVGRASSSSYHLESDEARRARIQSALETHGGNIMRASRDLGISRNTLKAYMRRHDLAGEPVESPRPSVPPSVTPVDPTPALAAPSPLVADSARSTPVGEPAPRLRWERRLVALLAVSLRPDAEIEHQPVSILQKLIMTAANFGGHVEEVETVGLVVAFGIDPAEDAARRAAYAALAMLKVVERSRTSVSRVTACCAIGVVRCFVALGSVVGMDAAARRTARITLEELLDAAEPGTIMVSTAAAVHLERRFELVPVGRADGRVGVQLRLGGRERSGLEAGGHTLSRFVGRDSDLTILVERLAQVEQGRGQVIGIIGEPGVGKSRLLYEFRKRFGPERVRFVGGRCLAHGQTTPYLPVIDLVREIFRLDEELDHETASALVDAGLQAAGLPSDESRPYLLHLLGFKEGTEPLVRLGPEAVKRRILETVVQLLLAESRRQPIVCAVEDLHWIDHTSETVLVSLAEKVAASPVLLITTYRPGYRPPWLGSSHASQHALGRLLSAESLSVVESVLPDAPSSLRHKIVVRAEGVPLFIEELALAVAGRDDAALQLAVPETLQAALMARLDGLAADDRRLLQIASVIGRDVPVRILAEFADRDVDEFDASLVRLRHSEFIYDKGAIESQTYTFKHSLTHEVTYESVSALERRNLHAAVARVMERLTPDIGERQPEVLAHHFTEAAVTVPAVTYWYRAGARARQRGAYVEAIQQLTRGLELLRDLPESSDRVRRELELQVSLGVSEAALRGFASPIVHGIHQRARELCRVVEAGPLLLGALGGLCQFYYFRADFAAARDLAEQHRMAVEATGERARLCASYDALGYISCHQGELSTARAELQRSLELYDTIPRPPGTTLTPFDIGVSAQAGLAIVLGLMGQVRQAIDHAERAIARAARLAPHAEALSLAWAQSCASRLYLLLGRTRAAIAHAEQAIEIGMAHGYTTPVLEGRLEIALALIAEGEVAKGVDLLVHEIEAWNGGGYEIDQSYWLSALAEGYSRLGDHNGALATLDVAAVHLDHHCERIWTSELGRIRGQVLFARSSDDAERAAAELDHAAEVAHAQGARLLELRALSTRQRIRGRHGRSGESHAGLAALLQELKPDLDSPMIHEVESLLDNRG